MADYVEQALQEMVPELDDLRRKQLFNEDEIRHIVRRRRDFEYTLQRNPGKPEDYLNYVRYEVALESLRRRRSLDLGWKKRSISDYAGVKRVHNVLRRGSLRFKGDMRLWYQHIDFCLRSGSTKTLNRVLLRAAKYHPKEIHLWLLAADRELQQGHVAAARKLLLRGLRCMPKSVKLLIEFVRLEAGVAGQLLAAKKLAEEEGEAAAKESADVWAPARLLVKKGLVRLAGKPIDCAKFLAAVAGLLDEAKAKWSGCEGLSAWAETLRQAAAERRPGRFSPSIEEVAAAGGAWADVPDDAAASIWETWWKQERNAGTKWSDIASEVAASSRGAVLAKAAKVFAQEHMEVGAKDQGPRSALLKVAAAPTASADASAALSVLEALCACSRDSKDKQIEEAYRSLLQRAALEHKNHLRLGLLAGRELSQEEASSGAAQAAAALLRRASGLGANDAAQLMVLASKASDAVLASKKAHVSKVTHVERLLSALEPEQSPAPIVVSALAGAMARGGDQEFQCECQHVRHVASNLWEVPGLRGAVLAAVLDCELRATSGTSPADVKRLCVCFEEVLSALREDSADSMDWWLRYIEFVQRMNVSESISGVPSASDLHWRAMRAVPDQTLYQERAQQLLQSMDT
eukprot:TRINITY_DN3487_c0_g1_i1.p1 TRINITY_DN3487_c0_g1~~TRINITY_DN3487_c0_g1_i1.p1  ORF type:complete len:654 (+),score=171.71 TRINITY_DN3487_c0_g1_i1:65-1963(+)